MSGGFDLEKYQACVATCDRLLAFMYAPSADFSQSGGGRSGGSKLGAGTGTGGGAAASGDVEMGWLGNAQPWDGAAINHQHQVSHTQLPRAKVKHLAGDIRSVAI